MNTISIYRILDYSLDGIIKRLFLIGVLAVVFAILSKKYQSHYKEHIDIHINVAPAFILLILFTIALFTLPFIWGILFFGNVKTFFVSPLPYIAALEGFLYSIFLLTIMAIVTLKYHRNFLVYLGLTSEQLKDGLWWGFFGFLILGLVSFLLMKYYKDMPFAQNVTLFRIFSTVFLGPVAEEVFYRGFAYPRFKNKVGIFWGMILASFGFMILHRDWGNYNWTYYLWLSMVYCFVYEKSKSLIAPIITHASSNFCSLIFGI